MSAACSHRTPVSHRPAREPELDCQAAVEQVARRMRCSILCLFGGACAAVEEALCWQRAPEHLVVG